MCFFKSGGNVDPAGRGWGSDVEGGRRSGKSRAGRTEPSGPQAAVRWTLAGVWRWEGGRWKAGREMDFFFLFLFFLRAAKVATCRSRVFRTSFLSGLQRNSQLGPNASCQKTLIETNCQRGSSRAPGAVGGV